jgi:hypothetical protein
MIKYQSETISFEVPIPFQQSEVVRAIVYLYTHASFVSKHSIDTADGYNTMTFEGGKLKGVVPAEETKKMQGVLKMDVMVVDKKGLRHIDSPATDVRVENKPITDEK